MSAAQELMHPNNGLPKTMKFCKVCRRDTPHQINAGEGILAAICVSCWQRSLAYELGRD